jgi:DNA-binding IclR family transcriptional regulator
MGKVLLAHSDAATINKMTRRKLRSYTENTITNGKRLRKELESVITNGYSVDREEITRGLVCIAAPVYGLDANVAAAISCTVSSFDATPDRLDEVTSMVQACARSASS